MRKIIHICEKCAKQDNLSKEWKKQSKESGYHCSLCFRKVELGDTPIETITRVSHLPAFLFEKPEKLRMIG